MTYLEHKFLKEITLNYLNNFKFNMIKTKNTDIYYNNINKINELSKYLNNSKMLSIIKYN